MTLPKITAIRPFEAGMAEIETSEGCTQYISGEDLGGLRVANEAIYLLDVEASEQAGENIEYLVSESQVKTLEALIYA